MTGKNPPAKDIVATAPVDLNAYTMEDEEVVLPRSTFTNLIAAHKHLCYGHLSGIMRSWNASMQDYENMKHNGLPIHRSPALRHTLIIDKHRILVPGWDTAIDHKSPNTLPVSCYIVNGGITRIAPHTSTMQFLPHATPTPMPRKAGAIVLRRGPWPAEKLAKIYPPLHKHYRQWGAYARQVKIARYRSWKRYPVVKTMQYQHPMQYVPHDLALASEHWEPLLSLLPAQGATRDLSPYLSAPGLFLFTTLMPLLDDPDAILMLGEMTGPESFALSAHPTFHWRLHTLPVPWHFRQPGAPLSATWAELRFNRMTLVARRPMRDAYPGTSRYNPLREALYSTHLFLKLRDDCQQTYTQQWKELLNLLDGQ